MIRFRGASRQGRSGQILVIFAGGAIAILAGIAIVVDGGNALAQQRATQNGADASAEAITQSVVIKAAYRALYDAKAGGGNTVKRTAATNDLHRRSYTHSAPLMSGSRY